MVVWLYGCAFERNPYECSILIELWLRKISILASFDHTTYTTAPVFQKRGFKQYVSNCWVLIDGCSNRCRINWVLPIRLGEVSRMCALFSNVRNIHIVSFSLSQK